MVCAASGEPDSASREALSQLCQTYWLPLYAYVRRRGIPVTDAQDLTQDFFACLLEKQSLRSLERAGGKFRAFLLTCLKNFLHNERDRARTQKRGGGIPDLSLDFAAAESKVQLDPADPHTPDLYFERQWALCLLESTQTRLRTEYEASDRQPWYARLSPILTGSGSTSYREIADALGSTEGAVKVAVHRMRQRFKEILREEISQTVASPADIDAEVLDLFTALKR